MRLSLLLVLAAALAAPAAQAQLAFGLKGGLNTAWQAGEDDVFSQPRLGAVGGVVLRAPLSPSLSLQAEGLYSQKGGVSEDLTGDITLELDYVEIPVLLRAALPVSPLLDVGLSAGGSVGIPVRTVLRDEAGTRIDVETETDFGAAVGLDVGSGPYSIGARYTFGLTDVLDDPSLGTFDASNQTVSLTFQALFGR